MPFRKPKEKTELEEAISDLITDLDDHKSNSPEYAAIASQLEKLYKLKDIDKSSRVSPDTLVTVGGNFLVAFVVVTAEKQYLISKHITTFLTKLK